MTMQPMQSALDTQMDPTTFGGDAESAAILAATIRERDELAAEAERLRRAIEDARTRTSRSILPRDVLELREQLDQREREIRRLKDGNLARERLLQEAREKVELLLHERGALEQRLAVRERASQEWETRIAVFAEEAALERRRAARETEARQSAEAEAAQLVSQAQHLLEQERSTNGEELARLRESIAVLEATREAAQLELRDRSAEFERLLADAKELRVREVAELRADFEEQRSAMERAHKETVEAAEQRHATERARREEAHAAEVLAERMARNELEESFQKARASLEQELEQERTGRATAEGRAMGERFAHAEREEATHGRFSHELQELRREGKVKLSALLEQVEALNADLERKLEAEQQRHTKELAHLKETVVRATREPLEARVEELEKKHRETGLQRDQLAERLAWAMHRVSEVRRDAAKELEAVSIEARRLARAVGELTWFMVEQSAGVSAMHHGRSTPNEYDVDEAISRVAERMPEDVAERLWGMRDSLLESLSAVSEG